MPYMIVVGEREAEARTISVRLLRGEKSNAMPIDVVDGAIQE